MTFHEVSRGCCSDLQLDQLLLNELSDHDRHQLRDHLAASPSCQARLDEMVSARDAYQPRPLLLAPVISASPASTPRRNRWLTRTSLLSGAMAASIAGVLWLQPTPSNDNLHGNRIKGTAVVLDVSTAAGRDVFANDALPRGTILHLASHHDAASPITLAVWQQEHATRVVGTTADITLQDDAWLLAMSCATPPDELQLRAAVQGDVEGCQIDRMRVLVSKP